LLLSRPWDYERMKKIIIAILLALLVTADNSNANHRPISNNWPDHVFGAFIWVIMAINITLLETRSLKWAIIAGILMAIICYFFQSAP
jgi:hypothetical protein